MADVQPEQVLAVLKRALKNRGITYDELAAQVGMSESGVKKLLTADDLSMTRLAAICDVLEVSVADVVREAAAARRTTFRPSDAQRAAIVAEPRLLLVLWVLSEDRGRLGHARARLGLDAATMRRLVRRLARIGLVEVIDRDRVAVVHAASDWRLPADVGRAAVAPLQDALLERARARVERGGGDDVELGFTRLRLHPDAAAELKAEMRALLARMDERSRRDRAIHPEASLVEVGALCALSPFRAAEALAAM